MRICLFICFFMLSLGIAFGQESSTERLLQANNLYEKGDFEEAIEMAKTCANEVKDVSQKWQAYRLLAMAYSAYLQPAEALEATRKMLSLNPGYQPQNYNDPVELLKLFEKIEVTPKVVLGVTLSPFSSITFTDVLKSYVVGNYLKTYTARNKSRFGLTVGYPITKRIGLESGVIFSQNGFDVDFSLNNWNVHVTENLNYLNIPLQVQVGIWGKGKLNTYGLAGGYAGYLVSGQNNYTSNNAVLQVNYELPNVDLKERRNSLNLGITAGLGASWKTSNGYLACRISYDHGLSTINKSETRFNYNEQIFTYFFLDDDMKLRNLTFSLGYHFILNYDVHLKKEK